MKRLRIWLLACGVGVVIGCEKPASKTTANVPQAQPPTQKEIASANSEDQPPEKPRPPTTDSKPAPNSDSQPEPPSTEPPAEPSGDVTVRLIDPDGLEAAIARHKGDVVLVDCWATWCIPCIRGFPQTVALSREQADEGLAVISLSFDDPTDEQTKAKVQEFLEKQEATFENYISELDLQDKGAEAFAIDDGALPHYKLYGRSGKLIRTFSNANPDEPFSHEALVEAVKEALQAEE
jgi:thiol-disulfide isomerase/thioredoxin